MEQIYKVARARRRAQETENATNPRVGMLFLLWYVGHRHYSTKSSLTISSAIRKDLHLSQKEVANSNMVVLAATLLMCLVCGPLCDRFGPGLVFVSCLFADAISTAPAGTIHDSKAL